RKAHISFAAAHKIHELKSLVQLQAHLRFAIGAAKYRVEMAKTLLEPACERQGRDVLRKRRGETHDVISTPIDCVHPLVDEPFCQCLRAPKERDLRVPVGQPPESAAI